MRPGPPGPRWRGFANGSGIGGGDSLIGPTALVGWLGRAALLVPGYGPDLVNAAMLRLLGLLDERYPSLGVVPDTPLHRRDGLAGGAVSD